MNKYRLQKSSSSALATIVRNLAKATPRDLVRHSTVSFNMPNKHRLLAGSGLAAVLGGSSIMALNKKEDDDTQILEELPESGLYETGMEYLKDEGNRGSLIGAGTGAALGGGIGAALGKGKRNRILLGLSGALAGGVGGHYLGGAAQNAMNKSE